jgi:uncharacterized protein YecE (DUF72 family)
VAAVQEEVGLYIGSMGWSYKFWPLYDGIKPGDYLRRYSEHFNSVEINSSFYRIPSRRVVKNWANQVPESFRFTAKFPQSISHAPELVYEEGKLEAFLRNISGLGGKLGPLLLQLPARFKADKLGALGDFLSGLPRRHAYAVEFRHSDWFRDETYRLLRDHDIALVQVEHPKWRTESELTADFTYIRWEGDRKKVGGEKGIVEMDRGGDTMRWGESISALLGEGIAVFGFFSKFYSGYPVSDIRLLQKALE